MAAWSAGAAATANEGADKARDGDGINDINGNGEEKLEERPAPKEGTADIDPGTDFMARNCAAASRGNNAATKVRQTTARILRTVYFF
ncbi:MAG: hypothetical protein COV48_13585 [Elusimicrobia bacterium CG11_big_fil_rev_8_21_14_0_20_64_6]|nr:MAG: hypothetical protein COV48_13585 [Elusimicrobia bacterium CG11_big_fil_rev_8_21_14_0_20_64_6]